MIAARILLRLFAGAGATPVAPNPPLVGTPEDGPLPVTVVIPAFNRSALLPRAIASVRAQTVAPAEIVVVDDGSTDDTRAVARELGARVVFLEGNRGASVARAAGVGAATQPWVALLDSDDEWLPWMLATLWPQREGRALVAGASVHVRDGAVFSYEGLPLAAGAELSSPAFLVWPQNLIPAAGTLCRRDVLADAMASVGTYRYSEDFATWLRVLQRERAFVVARPVVRYHVHAGQKSTTLARYADQHAIVREVVGEGLPLRRRLIVDRWDQERPRTPVRLLPYLRPRRAVATGGILLWRELQRRRIARLSAAGDLAGSWLSGR